MINDQPLPQMKYFLQAKSMVKWLKSYVWYGGWGEW